MLSWRFAVLVMTYRLRTKIFLSTTLFDIFPHVFHTADAPSAQIYTTNSACSGQPTLIQPLSVSACSSNQYDDNHSLDPYLHPTTAQTVPYSLTLTDVLTVSTQGVCIYAAAPDDEPDSAGLSAGAIAGIVIGTLIGAAILVYAGHVAYQKYYGELLLCLQSGQTARVSCTNPTFPAVSPLYYYY